MSKKSPKGTNHKIKTKKQDVFIPLLISFLIILLSFALNTFFSNFNSLFYDFFLQSRKQIKEDPRIILLDVDDTAIDKLGAWPWPRSYMADALIVLKEINARSVVFDIEYNTPSPAGINRIHLEQDIPYEFKNKFDDLSGQFSDFFTAIHRKQISLDDAAYFINDLIAYADETRDDLLETVEKLAVNNDDYLAQAMGLFKDVSAAYKVFETENQALSEKDRAILKERLTLPVTKEYEPKDTYVDIQPSLLPMMQSAKHNGYVNVIIDPDGKRRRLNPLVFIDGEAYTQLVFTTVLEWLGNPPVSLTKNKVSIHGAKIGENLVRIDIPLDKDGNMLINWPQKSYNDSFTHVSIYELVNYKRSIDELSLLFASLELRDAWKFPSVYPVNYLTQEKKRVDYCLELALEAQNEEATNDYIEAMEDWLESIKDFFEQEYNTIVIETMEELANSADENQATLLLQEAQLFSQLYDDASHLFSVTKTNKALLKERLEGSLCIIGYSGTGTTDIGATPFDKQYINVGTHASFANTIFQQDFLQESSQLIDIIFTLLIPLAFYFIAMHLNSTRLGISGILAIILCIIIPLFIFKFTGYYFKLFPALVALTLSYLIYSLIRYFRESREKSFLQKAIGTYVSNEVLNEIIEDPTKLKLGGESRHMSVMFSDVKGFSSISEKLTPEQLVTLLNTYLTGMSNIVLDEKGVVDKYEGDAIIAFWGAPNILENHAYHSIAAAVKMKALEAELNKTFIEENKSPVPLLTRFGINTGEMVAGNMGTERKMNYTVMGNAVNLAARLEGVNKMYGTWILTTDYTAKEAGDEFMYRRLDQVRVVGINKPVQLLEVIDFKNSINSEKESFLKDFEKALDLFNERNYKAAQDIFDNLLKINAEDGPSTIYRDRCIDFIKSPPAKDWDGVFNLTQK
jgi:adenylate cyclase